MLDITNETFLNEEAIPTRLMKWEYLLILYIMFAGWLVWYVAEHMLIWRPEDEMWGLPKPVAGMLLAGLIWVSVTVVVGITYYYVIKKRILSRTEGDER